MDKERDIIVIQEEVDKIKNSESIYEDGHFSLEDIKNQAEKIQKLESYKKQLELEESQSYLLEKRNKVLETIKPICETFNISDYDYEIDGTQEWLRIYSTKIGCSGNSISAVKQELVGYIFIKSWSGRSLGAFENQTKKRIKQYWKE